MPEMQASKGADGLIPARYYARAAELLMQEGVDLSSVLSLSGITMPELLQPEAQLTLQQVEQLLAAALAVSRRPDLALDLGRVIQLRNHSVAGFATLSSPSLDYALRLTARFFRLIFPAFRMTYSRGQDVAEIRFIPTMPMSHPSLVFHIEAVAVAAHVDIEELLGESMPPYDLYLSIDHPAHAQRYRELSNARCHFCPEDPPGIRMLLPAAMLARRPATADSLALDMAERRCRDLLDSVRDRANVGGWVRMMLRESSGGMPSLSELAHTLSVSPRTLDRYLKSEGLSFRAIQKDVRHERARQYLRETRRTVLQIALELGYTDSANFTRAFRAMEGCSPMAFRERVR